MSTDWYPRSRDEQLHMVDTWLAVFQTKASAWNIPPANVTSLTTADTNAKTILAVVKSGKRTAASVVECNEAFKEMETEARFIKKHFLRRPAVRGGAAVGWRGTKNVELVGCSVTFFIVIEELHLM